MRANVTRHLVEKRQASSTCIEPRPTRSATDSTENDCVAANGGQVAVSHAIATREHVSVDDNDRCHDAIRMKPLRMSNAVTSMPAIPAASHLLAINRRRRRKSCFASGCRPSTPEIHTDCPATALRTTSVLQAGSCTGTRPPPGGCNVAARISSWRSRKRIHHKADTILYLLCNSVSAGNNVLSDAYSSTAPVHSPARRATRTLTRVSEPPPRATRRAARRARPVPRSDQASMQ